MSKNVDPHSSEQTLWSFRTHILLQMLFV